MVASKPNELTTHIARGGQHVLAPNAVVSDHSRKFLHNAVLDAKSVDKTTQHDSWLMVVKPLNNGRVDIDELPNVDL